MYPTRKVGDGLLIFTFSFGMLLACACGALATDWPPPVGEHPNAGALCNLHATYCITGVCTPKTASNPKSWFICPGIPTIWLSVKRIGQRYVGDCVDSGTTCSLWDEVACVEVEVYDDLDCLADKKCTKFINANNRCLPSPG
jgi:hypothetical protein